MIDNFEDKGLACAVVIGGNIRHLRELSGLSQKHIAKVLGVSYQQIQKYESGQNRFPVENLYMLKAFYNVPYDIFFKGLEQHDNGFDDWSFSDPLIKIFVELRQVKSRKLRDKIQRVLLILMEA